MWDNSSSLQQCGSPPPVILHGRAAAWPAEGGWLGRRTGGGCSQGGPHGNQGLGRVRIGAHDLQGVVSRGNAGRHGKVDLIQPGQVGRQAGVGDGRLQPTDVNLDGVVRLAAGRPGRAVRNQWIRGAQPVRYTATVSPTCAGLCAVTSE